MHHHFIAALACAVAFVPAAWGQDLPEGLDLGAPEGARPTAHLDRVFDRYALPIGPFAGDDVPVRSLEGRVVRSAFQLDDTASTTADVLEGYKTRLEGLGFKPLFDCVSDGCGGFDFRFGAEVLPAPAMVIDTADFAQYSAHRPGDAADGAGEAYASVLVSRVLGAVYVQTVVVVPGEGGAPVVVTRERPDDLQQIILPQDKASIIDRLRADGHVVVQGLEFRAGDTTLSETSSETLDVIALALTRNPDLSVAIVGHSDNSGTLELNIELSRRRAESVREAMVERGVPEDRMSAHGVGWLAPLSSNAEDEGRALNRRVELVLK